MPGRIATTVIRETLANIGAEGIGSFCSDCISKGTEASVKALLAGGIATAAPMLGFVGLLVGPLLWEARNDAKAKRELDEKLKLLSYNTADIDRKATELLERAPDQFENTSKQQVEDYIDSYAKEALKQFQIDTTEDLMNIRVLSLDSNNRIIVMQEAIDRCEKMIVRVVDHLQKLATKDDLDALFQQYAGKREEVIKAELIPKLEAELRAKLAEEGGRSTEGVAERARRLADDAIRALQQADFAKRASEIGGAHAVLESVEREAQQHADAASAHAEASIQGWRRVAEWAYLVGEIQKAEDAINRILTANENDLDALNRHGQICELRGDLHEAKRLYQQVLDLASDDRERAVALGNIGNVEETFGNLDSAMQYFKRSLDVFAQIGDQCGVANQLNSLGVLDCVRGNLDSAEWYLKRSLAIKGRIGEYLGQANCLMNLGTIEQTRGNLNAAQAYYQRALAIDTRLSNKKGMANAFGNLGCIERTRGNLSAAVRFHERSLAMSEALGRKKGMAQQLGNLGLVEIMRGNLDAAEDHLQRSLEINEALQRKEGIADQLGNLGLIELKRGNLDPARRYHERSLKIYELLGHKEGMAQQLGNLGLVEQARGNFDAATGYLQRSLAIDELLGRKEGMANQLGNLGLIEHAQGKLSEARLLWARSQSLFTQVGARDSADRVQQMLDGLPPE